MPSPKVTYKDGTERVWFSPAQINLIKSALEDRNISISSLAKDLGIKSAILHGKLNGNTSLTPQETSAIYERILTSDPLKF
ncbi:MAG: hypothetical protein AABX90_04280, partial [Nanoarchaeota archaeon]